MNKDNNAYLKLMLDSFRKITQFIKDMTFESFSADEKTQSAVIMQFQILGELAKKVPQEIKDKIEIPWKQIAGLRDMVSHDYFSLEASSIWKTAKESAPEAEFKISEYVQEI